MRESGQIIRKAVINRCLGPREYSVCFSATSHACFFPHLPHQATKILHSMLSLCACSGTPMGALCVGGQG